MTTKITQDDLWIHRPIYFDVAFTQLFSSATYHIRSPHRPIFAMIKDYLQKTSFSYELHSPRPDELLIEVEPLPLEDMHILDPHQIDNEKSYTLTFFSTQTCIKKKINEHQPRDYAKDIFDSQMRPMNITYVQHKFTPPHKNHVKHIYIELQPLLNSPNLSNIPIYPSLLQYSHNHKVYKFFASDFEWTYTPQVSIQQPTDIAEIQTITIDQPVLPTSATTPTTTTLTTSTASTPLSTLALSQMIANQDPHLMALINQYLTSPFSNNQQL